jgi:hypothetical protein
VFRSPAAIVIWWVWLLFAVGNLIDLAIQGRDHLSLVAACILLFVTGIVYVTVQRPRIVADADGLTIANPVRDHRIDWAAVAGADPTDILRVRCEWPEGDGTRQRIIYSWAVHSSRRRQLAAEMRARRQVQRGGSGSAGGAGIFGAGAGGFSFGGFGGAYGAAGSAPAPEGDPLRLDADKVVAALTERAAEARLDRTEARATAPVSTWDLVAVAVIVVPGLALAIIALVLRPARSALDARRRVGRTGTHPVHVVGGRSRLDRRVYEDGQPPVGGQPAFVGVEHVKPGERVSVQGLHPDLDLAVEAEVDPVPAVKFLLVDLGNVVERDEHSVGGVLDDRSEGTVPAEILASETQAPALEPPGAPLRGMRAAQKHLRRIHVAAVGGV